MQIILGQAPDWAKHHNDIFLFLIFCIIIILGNSILKLIYYLFYILILNIFMKFFLCCFNYRYSDKTKNEHSKNKWTEMLFSI